MFIGQTRQNRKEAETIDEQEMLERLRRGDPAGLEALIERYIPYVAAIAARILPGCPQEWEELTADVVLCAWREHFPPFLFPLRGKLTRDRGPQGETCAILNKI